MATTLVVGGGAAGIAAARRLHDAQHDVLLVEASSRLGGRARTVEVTASGQTMAVDYGCGWLHSADRNPWVDIGRAAELTIEASDPHWRQQWRDIGFSATDQQAFAAAYDRWDAAVHASLGGKDAPLSDFIARDDRWRPMLDAISGYANGAPLTAVSAHDWAAYDDAATDRNWSVRQGYGALVVGHAVGVPVRLDTPVTRIDATGRRLAIHTAAGVIEADHVIVTVSTAALPQITFDPPLPDKMDAAADLPLGIADKIFIAVDDPPWGEQAHLIGNPFSATTASYRLSPFGWPIVEAFVGGSLATQLRGDDSCAFAIEELVSLLGNDWRRRLHPIAATDWAGEAFVHGSYSHARVGRRGARDTLAAPIDDRIFFAGEACSSHDFSTAHGAYATGVAAADAILLQRDG